jgi:exosortase A-associated hydrolase 1
VEQPLVFACHESSLVGILHLPEAAPRQVGVVIVVGGPQTRVGSHRQFVLMARDFARAGYPVLRFDYRGMGDSDGEVRTFEQVDDDIRAAVDALCEHCQSLRGVVLFGLCDAASAALIYCTSDRRLTGLMLANPWVRTTEGEARSYVRHYYGQRLLQASFWRKLVAGEVRLGKAVKDFVRSVALSVRANSREADQAPRSFLDRMLDGMESFARPVLVLMSERDLTAQEFMDRCRDVDAWRRASARTNLRRVALPGVDHTFSTPGAMAAATAACLAWLGDLEP